MRAILQTSAILAALIGASLLAPSAARAEPTSPNPSLGQSAPSADVQRTPCLDSADKSILRTLTSELTRTAAHIGTLQKMEREDGGKLYDLEHRNASAGQIQDVTIRIDQHNSAIKQEIEYLGRTEERITNVLKSASTNVNWGYNATISDPHNQVGDVNDIVNRARNGRSQVAEIMSAQKQCRQ
jgi:hypothetical protein